ncbi:hypothetical protein [Streptomyces sp. NPDC054962]
MRTLLAVASVVLVSGCAGGAEHGNVDGSHGVVRVSGRVKLLAVMEQTADAGKGFALKDATSLGRYIYLGQPERYIACFKREKPGMQAVELYAVPVVERCPDRLGAEVSAPKVPDLRNGKVEKSLISALVAGYDPKRLKVFKVEDPAVAVAPKPLAQWQVCAQNPTAGTMFEASGEMRLQVAKRCAVDNAFTPRP